MSPLHRRARAPRSSRRPLDGRRTSCPSTCRSRRRSSTRCCRIRPAFARSFLRSGRATSTSSRSSDRVPSRVSRSPSPLEPSWSTPSPGAARAATAAGSPTRSTVPAAASCTLISAGRGRDAVEAQRRLGVPLVTTFYGRDLSEAQRARFRDPYARLFSTGSAFLVEGPAMADRLAAAGAPTERVRLVPIGIDLEGLPFANRGPREPFVALQAARFVEKKGLDLTLRAFAEARPALGPSELWLVGDGPLRAELEKLADELRIQDAVRFLGAGHARPSQVDRRRGRRCLAAEPRGRGRRHGRRRPRRDPSSSRPLACRSSPPATPISRSSFRGRTSWSRRKMLRSSPTP